MSFFFFSLVTGFSKGYAFVEYKSERDANVAWRVSSTDLEKKSLKFPTRVEPVTSASVSFCVHTSMRH